MGQEGYAIHMMPVESRGHCDLTLEAKRQFWVCVDRAILD